MTLEETPDPSCGEDEVVLRVLSVSICSTDVSYFRGHIAPVSFPVVPGHEVVGSIVEIGSNLKGQVIEGQRLTYWGQTDFGGLAEFRRVRPVFAREAHTRSPEEWLTDRGFYDDHRAAAALVPESLPTGLASLAEPLTSVLRSLLHTPPSPGDAVTVLGAGPS